MSQTTFEIAQLKTVISLEPFGASRRIEVFHGTTKRVVETDHAARVRREITFADTPQPDEVFEIRYGTRSGGYVRAHWEGAENLALSEDLGRYDDYGTECLFVFKPSRARTGPYILDVQVLNGFAPGHRDVHFHLGRNRTYHALQYTLDLSLYSKIHHPLWRPVLFLHQGDPLHESLSRIRQDAPPVPCTESRPGLWNWVLEDVTGGLVDIYWDGEETIAAGGSDASRY